MPAIETKKNMRPETAQMVQTSTYLGWTSPTCAVTAAYQIAPKAAEVTRQIERLRTVKEIAPDQGFSAEQLRDVDTSVKLLSHLMTGPIPIPVAGWKPEGPSLFFDQNGFYGDLEIAGDSVEYFLKWVDRGELKEVFGTEDVSEGYLPPNLLAHLYSIFARSDAIVR